MLNASFSSAQQTIAASISARQRGRSQDCRSLDKPSRERLAASLTDRPFDLSGRDCISELARSNGTVLYLAYGSNLSYETFQKQRGIRPLAQVNVVVPELKLTFDLPGIPYTEPCFANTGRREVPSSAASDDKQPLLPAKLAAEQENGGRPKQPDYHKDRWKKGLVGVVYEVTPADYAHIIATEGGGSSYRDILVTCFALPDGDGSALVPDQPPSDPSAGFRAHTLFAPLPPPPPLMPTAAAPDRFRRPDPGYAQPSARYLRLLADGAAEHALPAEYRAYLAGIRPYTMTTPGQRLGQFVLLSLWGPFVALLFALHRRYSDERGRSPPWLAALSNAVFAAVWRSYDDFFRPLFGDGERTVYDDDGCGDPEGVAEPRGLARRRSLWKKARPWHGKDGMGDEEKLLGG